MQKSDIQIICGITKCTKEEAKKALAEAESDVARAILLLTTF